MIQQLADLQPIILVLLLVTMYCLESFRPYLHKQAKKKQHDLRNFLLSFISLVVNGFVGLMVLMSVNLTAQYHVGLLNLFTLPPVVEIVLSVLLIDFGSYCVHNMFHKIPVLWKLHRIHHSDPLLDTSSSLRFHPVEVVITQGLYQAVAVALFGVSMTAFIIYGTIGIVFVIIQHSNIRFPGWLENYGTYIFSTPGWHKIHHSDETKYTDSHYGDIFTFWDRIFGTWHKVTPEDINYGLKEFQAPEKQTVSYLLKSPFVKEINR